MSVFPRAPLRSCGCREIACRRSVYVVRERSPDPGFRTGCVIRSNYKRGIVRRALRPALPKGIDHPALLCGGDLSGVEIPIPTENPSSGAKYLSECRSTPSTDARSIANPHRRHSLPCIKRLTHNLSLRNHISANGTWYLPEISFHESFNGNLRLCAITVRPTHAGQGGSDLCRRLGRGSIFPADPGLWSRASFPTSSNVYRKAWQRRSFNNQSSESRFRRPADERRRRRWPVPRAQPLTQHDPDRRNAARFALLSPA